MRRFPCLVGLVAAFSLSIVVHSQSVSWYKNFAGNIGKYPITIHLHKTGAEYAGYYYYDKTQQPVNLGGSDTVKGDGTITLSAFALGREQINEAFSLNISGKQLTGEWKKTPESKSLPIVATETLTPGLSFDMIYSTGSVQLRPKLAESPHASVNLSTIWPRENNNIAIAIRKFINDAFGNSNSQQEAGKTFLVYKKQFLANYIKENKELADSDWAKYPYAYSLSEDQSIRVVYHSPRILTLANFVYSYTGGAHGNFGTSYTSFDLTTNKPFKIKSILTDAGIKKLNQLLEKNFRIQFEVKATDSLTEAGLFEERIEANDNFYLTGKGLGFNFAPYEIAPYALGEIDIFIPFTDLGPYLQPGFKKIIGVN